MNKKIKAVFNTSPLIFLKKLEYIEESLKLYDSCFIPPAVENELCEKKNAIAFVMTALQESKTIRVKKPEHQHIIQGLSNRLGKGEAEAIALAIEIDADFIEGNTL